MPPYDHKSYDYPFGLARTSELVKKIFHSNIKKKIFDPKKFFKRSAVSVSTMTANLEEALYKAIVNHTEQSGIGEFSFLCSGEFMKLLLQVRLKSKQSNPSLKRPFLPL
jgi:hypothetical protein